MTLPEEFRTKPPFVWSMGTNEEIAKALENKTLRNVKPICNGTTWTGRIFGRNDIYTNFPLTPETLAPFMKSIIDLFNEKNVPGDFDIDSPANLTGEVGIYKTNDTYELRVWLVWKGI